jgi:ATP-binding cassette subfamily C (CFTR/MRP) protein 1
MLTVNKPEVDYATDALIQGTIRREFAGCTSLVVAHRLGTVLDCDRVLVLDQGRLVEQGPPRELLAKPGSRFARMAQQEGLGNDAD